jgi:hypothetical protein
MDAFQAGATVTSLLDKADAELSNLYDSVRGFCESLGDDVQVKTLKNYFAFRRLKNFACIEVHPTSGNLLAYVKVDPDFRSAAGGGGLLATSERSVILAPEIWRFGSAVMKTSKQRNRC